MLLPLFAVTLELYASHFCFLLGLYFISLKFLPCTSRRSRPSLSAHLSNFLLTRCSLLHSPGLTVHVWWASEKSGSLSEMPGKSGRQDFWHRELPAWCPVTTTNLSTQEKKKDPLQETCCCQQYFELRGSSVWNRIEINSAVLLLEENFIC